MVENLKPFLSKFKFQYFEYTVCGSQENFISFNSIKPIQFVECAKRLIENRCFIWIQAIASSLHVTNWYLNRGKNGESSKNLLQKQFNGANAIVIYRTEVHIYRNIR